VEIHNINDPKNSPSIRIATDHHRYKRREEGGFPEEYKKFRSGLAQEADGTPIREWLGDNQRTKNLASFNIYTVEQLAEASDSLCQTLGVGTYQLRERAKGFIKTRENTAFGEQQAAENAVLKQQLAEMKAQMDRFSAVVDAHQARAPEQPVLDHPSEILPDSDQPPARRGRPRANAGA